MLTYQLKHLAGFVGAASLLFATVHGRAQVSGDATISGSVLGSPLTLKTSTQFGAGISSIIWRGKEFVNNYDHGRQFSTNASFFNRYECYNAYETGSKEDGQKLTSSAKVLSLSASGNTLDSSTQMCWYLSTVYPRPGFGDECGDPANFLNPGLTYQGPLSNYILHKSVTIGFAGISNVIEYLDVLTIPEVVQNGVIQMTTVLPWDFSTLLTYDIVSKGYRQIRSYGGEDNSVKVLTTADGNYAMGYYTPELLQPYGTGSDGGYRWGLVPPDPVNYPDPNFQCAGLGGEFRFASSGPADKANRSYFVIGNLEEVRNGLSALHSYFGAFDPDVFNWRDYAAINGLQSVAPDQVSAENHWVNFGMAQGKVAAKTFSPSQYLQLNPDIANAFGATNYQAAIGHYVSSGRSEGRGTVARPAGGMQHLLVATNRNVDASGQNVFGQLGTTPTGPSPAHVAGVANTVTEAAAGDYTSFAVKNDGSLWVWGSNQYGARGDGSSGDNLTDPVKVPLAVQVMTPMRAGKHAVAVGTSAYAVIDKNGQVWTWGVNWNGRLGDGSNSSHFTPARVKRSSAPGDYLTSIVSIAAGGGTMAAIDADGNIWTWGAGANGALGNGNTADSPYPVQVLQASAQNQGIPLLGATEVACGSSGFCIALTRYGTVFGWGNNNFAQLGIAPGGSSTIAIPILVGPTNSIDAIAAGSAHAIAHSANGNVYGWGYNGRGQLGTGSSGVAQAPPVAMNVGPSGMSDISELAAASNYSVMIRQSDRAVFVVGDNQSGQLGIPGNPPVQKLPVRSSF